ncbi:hypothetical protein AHAS_Ahas09G0145400 [Arachis hypogaea]
MPSTLSGTLKCWTFSSSSGNLNWRATPWCSSRMPMLVLLLQAWRATPRAPGGMPKCWFQAGVPHLRH